MSRRFAGSQMNKRRLKLMMMMMMITRVAINMIIGHYNSSMTTRDELNMPPSHLHSSKHQ